MNLLSKGAFWFCLIFCASCFNNLYSQSFRVVFYNVENYFDVRDDSLKDDNAFLPEGDYHWTWAKYRKKTISIAKVLTSLGEWDGAAIIGLCEVENDSVLDALIYRSPLKSKKYKYIHYESPDQRGVDVAMLFDPSRFEAINSKALNVGLKGSHSFKTRDILYVKGIVEKIDTLHIFVCHAPSRRGGEEQSEWKRMQSAAVMKGAIDSIRSNKVNANILIMGDFNDQPSNKSIAEVLKALHVNKNDSIKSDCLYNLYAQYENTEQGTHKFNGVWGVLDQIIVSGSLLKGLNMHTSLLDAHIYVSEFLVKEDTKNMGVKPNSTYVGPVYNGGISDHLPIYTDFYLKKEK